MKINDKSKQYFLQNITNLHGCKESIFLKKLHSFVFLSTFIFITKFLFLFIFLFLEILSVSCYSQDLLYVAGQLKVNSSCELYAKGGIIGVGSGQITSNGNIYIKEHSSVGSENWTNNASDNFLQGTGTVIFNSSESQNITGTNNTDFYNLTVNNTGSGVIIAHNIDVANTLLMTDGDIDLQNFIIDLGTTGTLTGETEAHRIKLGDPMNNTGTIQTIQTINNVTNFNSANLGLEITTDQDLGTITIVRGHQRQQGSGFYTENYSIDRYFDIPGIGEINGSNINIKLKYWDSELQGYTEANLVQYQSVTQSSNTWWSPLTGTVNTSTNIYTPANNPYASYIYGSEYLSIIFNDRFTLGSTDVSLPIELLDFSVKWFNNNETQSIVNWTTASETNSDYFEIQHTEDLSLWITIGNIQTSGNSSSTVNYENIDNNPYSKITYYRLKQVEYDGSYTYSNILALTKDNTVIEIINIYPNPAENTVFFEVLSTQNTNVNTYTIDMLGKVVFARKDKVVVGKNLFYIDIRHFASGVYVLKIVTETGNHKTAKQLIKK
jgi:hypothetical protein